MATPTRYVKSSFGYIPEDVYFLNDTTTDRSKYDFFVKTDSGYKPYTAPAAETPKQINDVLTTAFGNLDISKAPTYADTVGGTVPYGMEFTVGSQTYKYIPKETIQNGGFQSGKDAYVFDWFLNKDNLNTFSKNASTVDMSNTSAAKYLKDNNMGTEGYLVLADKVPFDTTTPRYIPDRTLNGLKNVDGQVVAGLAGGHGNSYVNTQGEVHDPYVEKGNFLGVDAETIGAIAPIAIAFVAPQLGASIAVDLGVSSAAGTAIASTALQVAAGADPAKALENAVTNAVVQTGSGAVATEINGALSGMDRATAAGLSNAAGSALASAATTAARGGSQQDIIDSAVAGAAGSAATTTTGEKAIGGAVAGALTGGTRGALISAAGGLAADQAAATPVSRLDQKAGADFVPISESEQGAPESGTDFEKVTVTAPRFEPDITTATYTPSTKGVSGAKGGVRDFGVVEVRAPRYEPDITAPVSETPPERDVPVEDRTGKPVDTTATYTPSLTTTSKVTRTGTGASVTGPSSTLARALQGDFYPTSTTGLTAYRPAGEIESEESGKKRQDVWNEASLRLKDALGI